jgi:hypothetical protein
MLEEILSVPKHRVSKVVTVEPELIKSLAKIDSKISFLSFVNYLKDNRSSVTDTKERFYNYLIEKFETEPSLLNNEGAQDSSVADDALLEMVSTSLFPAVANHDKISFALAAPYQFRVFYYSDSFRKLFFDDKKEYLLLPTGMPSEELKTIECAMIYEHVLEKFYGIKLNDSPELVYPITDANTGMKRYYRIRYDRRFIDIDLKDKLPPIQDCAVCLNTFRILDLEKQLTKMPLDLFEVKGFAVWVAEDVTISESLDTIKKTLLRQDECDTGIIKDLKTAIHTVVGLNDVEVGLTPFVKINNEFVLDEECTSHGLIGKNWRADDPESLETFQMIVGFITGFPQPPPISNLNEQMLQVAPFLRPLYNEGTRSFLMCAMRNSDGLLGLLELASPVPNLLTHEVLVRLESVIPLLSLAMLKNRETFHHKIEKVIKEKFTALQQSVEWKFEEMAWDYLRNKDSSSASVGFNNVYPLYGAIDIRNSSSERSLAIQKDIKEHLFLIDTILDKLGSFTQLPLLEGLKFKNETFRASIEHTMTAQDEVHIHEFLQQEVEPVFTHLQKNNIQVQEVVNNYFNMVNDSTSALYHFRCEYEDTLTTINDTVLRYLEAEEDIIQKSYPHYFEKYRTDGVEYNIYIGQSIAPTQPFDLLYLKNIRLWQLRSMAEVARTTHRLLPLLKVPLQTTQLIFIHSQCITISFRRDERRFDVEGSYNIRYEVIKKRLDKVCIKDSTERLTQPGMIALAYSNQKEVQEYQQYIEFLQNKNILKRGIEFLELEELQGVKGLKAMRVHINLEGN